MAQFINAFQITMGNEGGYANNPGDSGGETYAGISRNNWPSWAGWPAVDSAVAAATPPGGSVNISAVNAALSSSTSAVPGLVQEFYQTNFWNTEQLDGVNDQQLANQVFDTAVNMGTGTACILLQNAVNMTGANTLTVDGIIGNETLAAVNGANAMVLYTYFILLRAASYQKIVDNNPGDAQFFNSWFSRMPPYQPNLTT